jgi:allophanate hydrolase
MEIRLDLTGLNRCYDSGISPTAVVNAVFDAIETTGERPVWICLVDRSEAVARAAEIESLDRSQLPLYGVPFAVKDNIDVAGMPTTAACPAFSYVADKTAAVVTRLIAAGAILIGKTNLDQFATGLVGVRSPYGVVTSPFDTRFISGGSSSGSASAVATGLVSFSLGTDTAGSGRVPAAFNNIVGLKPTKGLLSAAGVVPACRSLDCVSVFALTVADVHAVYKVAAAYDESDSYSRLPECRSAAAPWLISNLRIGVPRADQLEFFGDTESEALYQNAIAQAASLGGEVVEIDFQPFLNTASLLYAGPWVAERLAAIQGFFEQHAFDMDSVVGAIISGAQSYSAADTFKAAYKLEEYRRAAVNTLKTVDILLLPTTGTTYTVAEIELEPIKLNTKLSYYTNFVNLLDLAGMAIPAGFRSNGLPFGVSLIGQANTDEALMHVADKLQRKLVKTAGALQTELADTDELAWPQCPPGCTLLSVVGAHLTGQPLNHQLTSRKARLALTTRTAKNYRLYALPNTTPEKPGLVKSAEFAGDGIEVEVWAMPTANLGSFVAEIPSPLGIGTVELENGDLVKGFICEPIAIIGAQEITHHGGWRNYRASK